MRRYLLSGLVLLAVLLGTAAPASAHNQLTGSDPEDGAQLEQGPERVRLTFLARLDTDAAELAVTGPDGASAASGTPRFDGTRVTIPVLAPLAGQYEVTYRVLSTDGHWAEGSIIFTVTVGSPSPSPSPPSSPSPSPSSPTGAAASEVAPAPRAGTDGDGGGFLLPWWGWLLVVAAAGAGAFALRRIRQSAS